MPTRRRISSASISARGMTGTWRARAFDDFGILAGNRRRHDDDIGVADMTAVVTGHHADAERRQTIGDVRSSGVGSADLVSEVHEQLSDAHSSRCHPLRQNARVACGLAT